MPEDPLKQLDQWLKSLAVDIAAVEFHGLLTGLISTRGDEAKLLCIDELIRAGAPPDPHQQEAMEALSAPFESLREQLNDPLLSFYPLMPGDDQPFDERIDALAAWCQGYLYGLSCGGIADPVSLSDAAGEFLEDMLSFSRTDNINIEGDEEDENALYEIIEYLRAGVMLLHDELQPVSPTELQSIREH